MVGIPQLFIPGPTTLKFNSFPFSEAHTPPSVEWQANTYVLGAEMWNIGLFLEWLIWFYRCGLSRASVILTKGYSYMNERLQTLESQRQFL